MRKSYSFVCLIVVGLLSSCASNQQPATADTEAFASKIIADKVSVAADAQRKYVALVAEDQQLTATKQLNFDTDEIDVDYIGKPQQLLQSIAYRYGYRYVETGKYSDLRTVNVRVQKWSPLELLRNVGHQIDVGADIELDKNAHVIRLIYKN